jgi:hypothetical protein
MLKDGTIFDSSKNYSNNDGPMSFVLGSGLLKGKNIIFKFIINIIYILLVKDGNSG